MTPSKDAPIAAGQPHRTLRAVPVQIHDYDALGVTTRVLPAGTVFQPWEPLPHWRGDRVPITLGDGARAFDWGTSSPEGHFLSWIDFFCSCGTGTAPAGPVEPLLAERPLQDPFAELPRIAARLRADLQGSVDRDTLNALLALEGTLAQAHAHAAEMQRGAEGYDNTESARRYDDVQRHLLAAAHEILQACKRLAR